MQELRFGDNDTLSAQVATLVEADYLFLLTDVDALYTANPKVRRRRRRCMHACGGCRSSNHIKAHHLVRLAQCATHDHSGPAHHSGPAPRPPRLTHLPRPSMKWKTSPASQQTPAQQVPATRMQGLASSLRGPQHDAHSSSTLAAVR